VLSYAVKDSPIIPCNINNNNDQQNLSYKPPDKIPNITYHYFERYNIISSVNKKVKRITHKGAAGGRDLTEYGTNDRKNNGDGKGHYRPGAERVINMVWAYY
jgi:hypothetical protein